MAARRWVADVRSHRPTTRGRRGLTIVLASVLALGIGSAAYVGVQAVHNGSRDGCSGSSTTVVIAASAGHYPVLEALSREWASGSPTVGGQCVAAVVVPKEAAEVAAALGPGWDEARDGPRPDVWVPDSSLWLLVAQSRPEAAAMLPTDTPSLASSPVVLAFRRELAEALGWPHRELGWEDVVGAILQPDTWARVGHQEWATLRLGVTDPTVSSVALASVLLVLDQDGDGNVTDAELGASIVFTQSLGSMAPDSSTFFTELGGVGQQGSTSVVAAFPASEREVATHNHSQPSVALIPVYPRQGTIVADYPYAVLNAGWVDETSRAAAAQFLQFALGPTGQKAFGTAGFRGPDHRASNGVSLPVDQGFREVLPALRPAPTAASLSQIVGAWTGIQRPANILTLVDTSGSMAQPVPGTNLTRLQLMQQTAAAGFNMLTNRSSMGLWEFSSELTPTTDYRELVPFGPIVGNVGGVPRLQALLGSMVGMRADGGTGLYDTVYAAYGAMQAAWQPDATTTILVITDGRNEQDVGLNLEQLLALLARDARPDRPLPVIGLAVGPEADADALREISRVTGGRTFVVLDPASAINTLILAFAGRLR